MPESDFGSYSLSTLYEKIAVSLKTEYPCAKPIGTNNCFLFLPESSILKCFP